MSRYAPHQCCSCVEDVTGVVLEQDPSYAALTNAVVAMHYALHGDRWPIRLCGEAICRDLYERGAVR